MCGVAGIFAYHYAAPSVEPGELRVIRDAMALRGPDAVGEWVSNDAHAALGHRRLSIIDLSDAASQPMISANGKYVISFNGEIYNYKGLRSDLEKKGYRFRTHSDTEVLLHLYAEKGENMVHDLRGMFAFILWDSERKAMFLARDPYGIKPLYYADDGWTVRIASQVKALLKSPKVSRLPDPGGIAGFFLLGSVPEPSTLYQEIKALPAGSTLWIDSLGPAQPKSYFSIAQQLSMNGTTHLLNDRKESNILHEAKKAILESLRYHYVSDVPVGVFLSSGKDSSTLAALSKEIGIRDLRTVTLSFKEFKGLLEDEGPLAEAVSRQYGTLHRNVEITQSDFIEELPKFLNHMDQPSIDAVNVYFVSKAAKEAGLKVAVSGVGGDELFGGYPSFKQIPQIINCMRPLSFFPFLGDAYRQLYSACSKGFSSLKPKYAGLIKYGKSYQGAYFLKRGLFMPWELEPLLGRDMAHEGLRRFHVESYIEQYLQPDPRMKFKRVCALESSLFLRNQLLRDADWAGMAHSLEIRTPFVDALLLRRMAPLMNGSESFSKDLLVKTPIESLPSAVLQREKTGFSVPMNAWLDHPSVDTWKKVPLLSRSSCHWSRRWAYTIYKTSFSPQN